ncbi:glycosyltransferase [Paenibacillus psychroresistens]|uniref:Glycosyltransferase n=1 Tax=Paenibacillus psychroresistens TaxID=1778678 RepID=A0A6B8REK2_9BACL|nr:glycosyltransferase [Paenibacillus psychroresistens]QGQ94921.1 glycosyltransferase [Paenibacillus psychroresistens]
MKSYVPYIFCIKRKNKNVFPHKKVIIDPHYHKLNHKLKDHFFKLIHARFGTSGIRMLRLKEKWQIPLITSFHGCDSPGTARMKKHKRSLQRLFSVGECFTVPCLAMKQELVKHGCPISKIVVQYSGINLDQFAYKERFYPLDGQIRIVHVGRLVEKKGAEILIKAFHRIQQIFPQARLILIGTGRLLKKLKQLSLDLHLENNIEFLGALPHSEIAKHLEEAHIFCLPSLKDRTGNREGIPNAIKEAMACGLPVVSTFHSGIPELIKDGKNGLLVKENDVSELATKLIVLIKQPETWRKLGLNARVKIEADFNREIQTNNLERLFDQVIKAHEKKQNEKPLFSVIIPTYNRERFLGRAIKSVLQQTCKDYELIVVDDGSTDQTAKIVKSFGPRVRYVYQKNSGPSEARNMGISLAKGKYIAFLDSDDYFLAHKLKENKTYLEAHPDCHFLYSWYYNDKFGSKRNVVRNSRSYWDLNAFRFHLYRRKFTIRTSTAVIQKSCFDKTGLFNSRYRYSQDWDMWLRLACHYTGKCQKTPLAVYRRHERKVIPAGNRHFNIRKTALELYRWNKETLLRLEKKYGARRSAKKNQSISA